MMNNKKVAQPDSGTAVDSDALSKEDKEALLTKKMNMIRERNKAISERHKLIEADRRRAEEAGQAVKPSVDSQTLPAEGAPKPRGRGRGHLYHGDNITPGRDKPKFSGIPPVSSHRSHKENLSTVLELRSTSKDPINTRDTTLYEPIVDTADLVNYKGRGQEKPHDKDALSNTPRSKRNHVPKNENTAFPNSCEYEPIVDITDLDKRFGPLLSAKDSRNQSHHPSDTPHASGRTYKGRLKDDEPSDTPHASGRQYKGRLKDDEPSDTPHASGRQYRGRLKDDEPSDTPHASGRTYKGRLNDDEPADSRPASGRGYKGRLTDDEPGDIPQTTGRAYKGKLKDDESGDSPQGLGRPYKGRLSDDDPGDMPHGSGRAYMGRAVDDDPGDGSHASGRAYKGRLKDDEGPPPDPSFNPLADRSRTDQKDGFSDHKRHPRNYGGSVDLTRVKQSMRHMKEKERDKPPGDKPLMMVMTGRERKRHEEWKAEREKYDKERIQRQMNNVGSWRRAWDVDKVAQESDEQDSLSLSSELEPIKRPGGLQQYDQSDPGHQIGGIQEHQQSLSDSQDVLESRAPRGRGRGRGRGRAYVREFDGKPTSRSRGDDRTVECQKDLLLVKIDNTSGGKSTEVNYEDDYPVLISATPGQSQASTVPRRGPTGRTSNHDSSDQLHGGRQYEERTKPPHHKERPKATQRSSPKVEQVETPHIIPNHTDANHGPDERQVNSESCGDSDEWEDCSDTSDVQDEDDSCQPDVAGNSETKESVAANNLHLECTLDPVASDFVPESPDFMKTPPGHVKVLNWATDGCPTSPSSQDSSITSPPTASQGSLTSPQPCPTSQASVPSPHFPAGRTPAGASQRASGVNSPQKADVKD